MRELSANARTLMNKRYARKDADGDPTEDPMQVYQRVANNVAVVNALYVPEAPDEEDNATLGLHGGVEAFPWKTAWRAFNYLQDTKVPGWTELPSSERQAQFVRQLILGAQEYMDQGEVYLRLLRDGLFLPNSPTWTGAGTPLGQLAACFVLPIADDLGRQRDSIFETLKVAALIQQTGGGNGFDFSRLRPHDSIISKSMGKASGPVGFLEAYNAAFQIIAQGGSRRGANMAVCRVDHPNIYDFIRAKVVEGKIEGFNCSVAITDEFMECVENDKPFDLVFEGRVYKTIEARDLFNEITQDAHAIGDPGCLFIDRANRDNPCPLRYRLEATNPCLSAGTLVATADGRGAVSIGDLAASGEDVPVYSYNRETDAIEVKLGIHPRLTGHQVPVYDVVLDNGTSFRVTGNHKFVKRDGSLCEAIDLGYGDSLMPFSRWYSSYNATNNKYWFASLGFGTKWSEHRLIADFCLGPDHGMLVHHQDFDGLNNDWDNLIPVTDAQHRAIHDNVGSRNGMWGRKHDEETKRLIGAKSRGRTHNRGRKHSAAVRAMLSVKARERWDDHRITKQCEWCQGSFVVPLTRREQSFCSYSCLNLWRVRSPHSTHQVQATTTRLALCASKKERQAEVFRDLVSQLGRRPFKTEWIAECKSRGISTRLASTTPLVNPTFRSYQEVEEAAMAMNHRVVEVRPAGVEDVYNITVEDNHTLAIVAEVPRRDHQGITLSGVITTQCGEQWLPPYGSCNLGSIAVSRFANWDGTFNWDRFAIVIEQSVQFLDDVIDANQYVAEVPELAEMGHNERRIGLGLMGVADVMAILDIGYGTEKGQAFISQLHEFMRYHAMLASIDRAQERGPFPWIEGSIYDPELLGHAGFGSVVSVDDVSFKLWAPPKALKPEYNDTDFGRPTLDWDWIGSQLMAYGIRNACQTTDAPTGTISNVADLYGSGIEPFFALAYKRTVVEQQHVVLDYQNDLVVEWMERCQWSTDSIKEMMIRIADNGGSMKGILDAWDRFPTAADLTPEEHVWMQAASQPFVDNSISKTINMPNSATVEDVREVYKLAHRLGCKGITIYRQGSRQFEILTTKQAQPTIHTEPESVIMVTAEEWPVIIPMAIPSNAKDVGIPARVFPVKTAFGNLQVTLTEHPRFPGRPFDVRLSMGKSGSDKNADVEGMGRMLSGLTRAGVSVTWIVEQLEGIGGHTSNGFGPNKTLSIADAVGKLLRRIYLDSDEDFGIEEVSLDNAFKPLDLMEKSIGSVDYSMVCPNCLKSTVVVESGCKHCSTALGGCGVYSGCD